MKIEFEVEGSTIEFSRDPWTGHCTLDTGTEVKVLQSALNPLTHFGFGLKRRWQCSVKGHEVIIEKERPLLFAGVRPQGYRVLVDGRLVRARSGF